MRFLPLPLIVESHTMAPCELDSGFPASSFTIDNNIDQFIQASNYRGGDLRHLGTNSTRISTTISTCGRRRVPCVDGLQCVHVS